MHTILLAEPFWPEAVDAYEATVGNAAVGFGSVGVLFLIVVGLVILWMLGSAVQGGGK